MAAGAGLCHKVLNHYVHRAQPRQNFLGNQGEVLFLIYDFLISSKGKMSQIRETFLPNHHLGLAPNHIVLGKNNTEYILYLF